MLSTRKDLIPSSHKDPPLFVVAERHKDGRMRYVKHLGVSQFPIWTNDEILEQTDRIEDASKFCRQEDAEAIARSRCTGGCNCGHYERTGLVFKLTLSWRRKDGVTYGFIDCEKPGHDKEWFETMFDVEQIAEFKHDQR